MSGRVHDLITAENFAKWAEERPFIEVCAVGVPFACAGAQFLWSLGLTGAYVNPGYWGETLNAHIRHAHESPRWMNAIVDAFDRGTRSGPALAKIARENA
jgi:hypothetical protein